MEKSKKKSNLKKRKTPKMIPRKAFGLSNGAIHVLADLWKAKRPLSVSQIAERNNIVWKTANDHVESLKKRGLIKTKKSVRRTYCEIKKEFMRDIKI